MLANPKELWSTETTIQETFGHSQHSGWVLLSAPLSQPPVVPGTEVSYQLKLNGRQRAMRVRAIRVFGDDRMLELPSSVALLQPVVSPLPAEALQVFKLLAVSDMEIAIFKCNVEFAKAACRCSHSMSPVLRAEQERVIFALDRDDTPASVANALDASDAPDGAQLHRAGSQNLREHMIGILFAG